MKKYHTKDSKNRAYVTSDVDMHNKENIDVGNLANMAAKQDLEIGTSGELLERRNGWVMTESNLEDEEMQINNADDDALSQIQEESNFRHQYSL